MFDKWHFDSVAELFAETVTDPALRYDPDALQEALKARVGFKAMFNQAKVYGEQGFAFLLKALCEQIEESPGKLALVKASRALAARPNILPKPEDCLLVAIARQKALRGIQELTGFHVGLRPSDLLLICFTEKGPQIVKVAGA